MSKIARIWNLWQSQVKAAGALKSIHRLLGDYHMATTTWGRGPHPGGVGEGRCMVVSLSALIHEGSAKSTPLCTGARTPPQDPSAAPTCPPAAASTCRCEGHTGARSPSSYLGAAGWASWHSLLTLMCIGGANSVQASPKSLAVCRCVL